MNAPPNDRHRASRTAIGWLRRVPRVRTADLLALADSGRLDAAGFDAAMRLAGCQPDALGWRAGIERLLLMLAGVLLIAGVVCVVAYNWAAIGRWGRFLLAEAVLAGVVLGALRIGLDRLAGKSLLALAIGLIGPMLALFGQAYQTGADVWELFLAWALLALPWTFAARFAPAWLLWLAVVEIGLLAWVVAYDLWLVLWFGRMPGWLLGAALNAAVLVAWELAARRFDWMSGRLGPRLAAAVTLAMLTAAVCMEIFGIDDGSRHAGVLLWVLVLAAGWWAYRRRDIELGMLSMGWLSITAVAMALMVRLVIELRAEWLGLFLGAGLLIASSAWARHWLRTAAREAES